MTPTVMLNMKKKYTGSTRKPAERDSVRRIALTVGASRIIRSNLPTSKNEKRVNKAL